MHNLGCPDGFSLDSANGLCYKVLDVLDYQSSAVKKCYDGYDGAELLVFNNDAEAMGFKNLISKGTLTKNRIVKVGGYGS